MKFKDLIPKKDVKAGAGTGSGFSSSTSPQDQAKHPVVWTGTRSVNGTHFLRSNLFIFLLGQIVMLSFWAITFASTYGQNSQKFLDLATRVASVESNQTRMDEHGTNASKYGLQADQTRFNIDEARLTEVEKSAKKIDVMDERLGRIDEAVRDIRANMTRK